MNSSFLTYLGSTELTVIIHDRTIVAHCVLFHGFPIIYPVHLNLFDPFRNQIQVSLNRINPIVSFFYSFVLFFSHIYSFLGGVKTLTDRILVL